LQALTHSDAYQSMRASGPLANMPPHRVEFLGIA
jgi:hypothetical protein